MYLTAHGNTQVKEDKLYMLPNVINVNGDARTTHTPYGGEIAGSLEFGSTGKTQSKNNIENNKM
jgi:hypothetical protein